MVLVQFKQTAATSQLICSYRSMPQLLGLAVLSSKTAYVWLWRIMPVPDHLIRCIGSCLAYLQSLVS